MKRKNIKVYKPVRHIFINMLPGDPAMGCRMSPFSKRILWGWKTKNNKAYKLIISNNIKMHPSDPNGSLDDFS